MSRPGLEELNIENVRRDRHTELNGSPDDGQTTRAGIGCSINSKAMRRIRIILWSWNRRTVNAPNRKAQAVIDRTRYLIEDKKKLRGWIKGLLRDGDLFLQVIVDTGNA